MKIEIRETKENGIVQVTTLDERWYHILDKDEFYPSSTWICGYYPKGIPFYKWLAEKGWDEAEAIKVAAGNKGSRIHHAIECLTKGTVLSMTDVLPDSEGEQKEFSVEEWEAVMSFVSWWKETKPVLVCQEQVVVNHEEKYAGTLDLVVKIDGEPFIVDIKTGQNVWREHELQISSYKHAYTGAIAPRMAILQIGFKRNKKGFKFTEIDDCFDLFLAAKQIWKAENENVQPKQKDYPITLSLKG